jgi:ribonucleoside-diphosphate reductase alpha chain
MYSSPILSNARLDGDKKAGLPISCFLSFVDDSLEGLIDHSNELRWMSVLGGGVGGHWSSVRTVSDKSPGPIPFIKTIDSDVEAYRQGKTRKGSYACYLDVSHPDIIEFLNIRVPTGGDTNRKCFNINNAVNLSDAFMQAVLDDQDWNLIDPNNKQVKETIKARELWQRILEVRFRTGEPYFFFSDTANKHLPQSLKDKGLKIHGSNLCNEIFLATSKDRSAVCCLSSLNIEYFDEWKDTTIIEDCITFLDNVLQYFIENAPKQLHKAIYSAIRERSLGLGAMGFHSYLQRKNIAFESAIAKSVNMKIFKLIKERAVKQTEELAKTRGEYLDGVGTGRRNSHLLAIAPNANSAIILDTSPSIEPWKSNAFTHRTRAGSFLTKNKYLDKILLDKNLPKEEYDSIWQSIILNQGSVQHLDCLTDYQKDVFKTAFELDQMWLIEHGADRQQFVCQGQSLNLFFPSGSEKSYVNAVHVMAWKKGLKGLYYLRTNTGVVAEKVSTKIERKALKDYDECIACQG